MEQKDNAKVRLKLNLFDGIVLVLALVVGGLLVWNRLKPADTPGTNAPSASSTVRYTVRFQRWQAGTSSLIESGDNLVDNVKNFEMGTVVSAKAVPAVVQVLDHQNGRYVDAVVDGFEDVLVTVETSGKEGDMSVELDGGYSLRVGNTAYVRGEGYMGSGPIVAIEREEQA